MQGLSRDKILKALLPHIPFDGWDERLFTVVADELGTTSATLHLYFEEGISSAVAYFSHTNDQKMLDLCRKNKIHDIPSVREKVKQAVLLRLSLYTRNRPLLAKTMAFLSWPGHVPLAMRLLFNTADLIWAQVVGDTSVDFNYYTKRSLLMGVIASTVLYFMADDSPQHEETARFLQDRLDNVIQVGKFLNRKK